MEPNEDQPKPFRFDEPRQERIYQRLLLVGSGPASFYRDACQLMAGKPLLDSTTHLVAHLVRDIESALRDVLEPLADRSAHSMRTDVSTSKGNSHSAEIRAVLTALQISEADPVAQAWLALPGERNAHGLAARAHRDALTNPRPCDCEFRQFWTKMEDILDIVLEKFESRYLDSHHLLDELLTKDSPTQKDAERFRLHAPNNLASYGYFFDKLTSPAWLAPLTAEGFFKDPAQPQSRYLARMASLKPDEVSEIILSMADTDNGWVNGDLADAALTMPPELSARLAGKTKKWAQVPDQPLLPEKLGSLVAHLARGGQVDEALKVARALLEVLPGTRTEGESEMGELDLGPPEPTARIETWDYQQILKKDFPDLLKAAGTQGLVLLCDHLEVAIQLRQRRGDDEGQEDLSYIWRRAIEDHTQNHLYTLKDILVSGVRNSAELLAQWNSPSVRELVSILESRPWKVFHRIALHLLRRFPDSAPDLVAARLLDRSLFFDDVTLRHEYVLLLGERFGSLTKVQQQTILNWIDEGPSPDKLHWVREQVKEGQSADECEERYRKSWQCKRLAWLKRHLSGAWKERYEALVSELGEPEHPEFRTYTTAWTGPTSPKSTEELRAMSVEEVVDFLRSWHPTNDPRSPSPEGLGRILKAVVSEGPTPFAAKAERFQGLDPTYVRALISGFREAVKKSQSIDWPPVLGLCRWVVDQPREIPGRESEYADLDPGWVWTRKAVAELLSAGFDEGAGCISIEHRHSVWEILNSLTDDPEPTPEYEARYGGSNIDPATLSINTTRGEAMHAVVRYGLWVHRHLEELPDSEQRLERGFDEMPEVRDILDKHLDVARDPSLAVRSVYGQWFPWLVLLDKSWTRGRVWRIFPSGEFEKRYRDAAWETYVIFCSPYDEVFEVLRNQYLVAVECVGTPREERRQLDDPDPHLAEHLMTFYWRGKLNFGDPDGFLSEFWRKAPDPIRGHALSFIGRQLDQWKDTVPPQPLQRLKALWEGRLAAAKKSAIPDNYIAEMSAFGWWFASGQFEDVWAIKQLDEALKIAGEVEREETVVERLAGLSQVMPREALQCLEALIKGDKENWRIHGWRVHIRTILTTALRGADPDTRTAAENLVHYLGSRRHFQFRDLLQSASPGHFQT